MRDLIQRTLAVFRRLLFIGCGDTFADPNFTAMIRWLRSNTKAAAPEHYAVVRNNEVADRYADPTWQSFVEPVGYGDEHADLSTFISKLIPLAESGAKAGKTGGIVAAGSTPNHPSIISDYLRFLLRDCGQMTIEGVRADMDLGQRKFDIERLFVPLKVLQCPPDIPEADPQREQKLRNWEKKNGKARPFGKVFEDNKRLALLALPGGGKTLLLKRLAVAYADPARRRGSEDALPDMDVIPVLIRCREWREHIQSPILAILHKLPEITGDPRLAGLGDALLPVFKKGRVLLLIDGLDEIHNDAHRTTFVEHLEAFLEEYDLTRVVVTSREAGFSLVAPCIARFCSRWRVAPLETDAITALCDHWQVLMAGNSPEARAEGRELAAHLVHNDSLCRLAENPLLLTMLLVVKHGAGRLPPDRVSLYNRAVEVLLDTWNINGHDPLNPKEAVPQLACVAFQMMRDGKQTATEKELLTLLEEAREKEPQIQRYARGTPHEFLKRVELRSSLLVEAGHQVEEGKTVPFYQFRHLTFQEYLAAVAAVEGHYMEYKRGDTLLTPLADVLTAEEWKEVVPMAAVLARKQAEPLISALVNEAAKRRADVESGSKSPSDSDRAIPHRQRLYPSVARLVQCLVEEAEPSSETLTAALQLITFFAEGCHSEENWRALVQGPFGAELLHQAWLLYESMKWPNKIFIFATLASLSVLRRRTAYWPSPKGISEIQGLLQSKCPEEVTRGLFTCVGLMRERKSLFKAEMDSVLSTMINSVERHMLADDVATYAAAAYTLCHYYYGAGKNGSLQMSLATVDRLLAARLHGTHDAIVQWSRIALSTQNSVPRGKWTPTLTNEEIQQLRHATKTIFSRPGTGDLEQVGDLVVAFHAKTVWPEDELAMRLAKTRKIRIGRDSPTLVDTMLSQMGEVGRKHLARPKKSPRKQR